jgi:ATP-dependent Lon protease
VLLETLEVDKRLTQLNVILAREIELMELGQKIQGQVQTELTRNQKEFYLRQQLKAIQKELGEADARQNEVEMLRARIEDAKLPEEARKAADAELERLAIIPPSRPSTRSCARTSSGWQTCPGPLPPRTTSTRSTRARFSTKTTSTSRR